jgi:SAM-dependent methyltransferase
MDPALRALLRCPDCRAALDDQDGALGCRRCGQRFPVADGIPDLVGRAGAVNLDEVATQDRVSDCYEERRYRVPHSRAFHRRTVEAMCARVRLAGLVLDDGCGNGFLFEVGAPLAAPGARLIGVDISAGMLAKARRHSADLVRGDSARLPFADGCFDAVFARSLLHHLPEPEAGVREIARVLRPGGELVALDTHRTVLSDLPRRIANRGEHFDAGHKNFRGRELTAMVGRHLVVDRVDYLGYVAYPLLAFPDLIDFSRLLPLAALARPLLALDDLLASVPGVRRLGWGIAVKAHRAR